MGSAFVAYGILLTIILLVGQVWLRRTGRSQEFYDSAVIAAWGCVNTFTEHRWGSEWVRNDWQHTTMGIIWWCAGLAGVWLSRDRDGNPKRNFIPSFVIFITGWAMSAHPQELHVSAATHSMFGYTLMSVGVSRIVEIAFVLRDKQSIADDGRSWNSFQFIPVFVSFLTRTCRKYRLLTLVSAFIRGRLPLHGRYGRADGAHRPLQVGSRLLHSHSVLDCVPCVHIQQHVGSPLRPTCEPPRDQGFR